MAFLDDDIQSPAVVPYKDPVPDVEAITIDGNWLILQGIGDNQGNQLLGKLVWPEVIGTAGNDYRNMMRLEIGMT
jgi:hypothetical protein